MRWADKQIESFAGFFWPRLPYELSGTVTAEQVSRMVKDIGVKKEQISKFVEVLFSNYAARIKANPRPISRDDAIKLYESAW